MLNNLGDVHINALSSKIISNLASCLDQRLLVAFLWSNKVSQDWKTLLGILDPDYQYLQCLFGDRSSRINYYWHHVNLIFYCCLRSLVRSKYSCIFFLSFSLYDSQKQQNPPDDKLFYNLLINVRSVFLAKINLMLVFQNSSAIIIIVIIIIIIVTHWELFTLVLADGLSLSLSESKFLQISRTLLSILANLNNSVVWMIFSFSLSSKYSRSFSQTLAIIPSTHIAIGNTVTFVFYYLFQSSINVCVLTCLFTFFYHFTALRFFFPANVSWCFFFYWVKVTGNLLKSPGFFSVFWPIFVILWRGWSLLVLRFLSLIVPLSILLGSFQVYLLQLVSPTPSCSIASSAF